MDAPLAARGHRELEVLHRVGRVGARRIEARFGHGRVEQLARWSDEGFSAPVLDVAGLLSDQHQSRADGALAEHGLGRALMEMTTAAVEGGLAQAVEVG